MKIFISGPMTNLTDYNRASFNRAAKHLQALGHVVSNPAILPDGWTYNQYIETCLVWLRHCDSIVYLTGHELSNGVMTFEQPEAEAHSIIDRTSLLAPIQEELNQLYFEASKPLRDVARKMGDAA